MKKNMRKVLSLALALMMLCSVMSISAFATPADPEITVYFTRGNFTPGGYDFANDTFIASTYNGDNPAPAADTAFASDLFEVTISLSDVNTSVTRTYYNAPNSFTGNPNALDVIIQALLDSARAPYGGWDSTYGGGAIYGFDDDGSTDYFGYTVYPYGGHTYNKYTGTNWQIAYSTSAGGTLSAASGYGTSITNLFDGMVIVFDLSAYEMYYKVS